MERLEHTILALDYLLDTKRKRHIIGGVLLSVSSLFAGLALMVITIKNEGDDDERKR